MYHPCRRNVTISCWTRSMLRPWSCQGLFASASASCYRILRPGAPVTQGEGGGEGYLHSRHWVNSFLIILVWVFTLFSCVTLCVFWIFPLICTLCDKLTVTCPSWHGISVYTCVTRHVTCCRWNKCTRWGGYVVRTMFFTYSQLELMSYYSMCTCWQLI